MTETQADKDFIDFVKGTPYIKQSSNAKEILELLKQKQYKLLYTHQYNTIDGVKKQKMNEQRMIENIQKAINEIGPGRIVKAKTGLRRFAHAIDEVIPGYNKRVIKRYKKLVQNPPKKQAAGGRKRKSRRRRRKTTKKSRKSKKSRRRRRSRKHKTRRRRQSKIGGKKIHQSKVGPGGQSTKDEYLVLNSKK